VRFTHGGLVDTEAFRERVDLRLGERLLQHSGDGAL
jgi:hypothetical protein